MRLFLFTPPTSSTCHQQHFSSSFSPFLRPPKRRRSSWRKTLLASSASATPKKDKLVVIMGATGTGKSRLSVDLATRFFPSEIINSDKMQLYKGLDITTNKIPCRERRGVPHHFLGEFVPDSDDVEFTPGEFRSQADKAISDIVSRKKTPLLVGGSNSFIYSLLAEDYDPELNVFDAGFDSDSVSSRLRYDCCFLWVDSSLQVLYDYLNRRVDEMLDSGMLEELAEFFDSGRMREAQSASRSRVGLMRAIGVPEFERFFKTHPPSSLSSRGEWDRVRRGGEYEEGVREIKENTCQLAKRQIGKILKLRGAGWDLRRLDATTAFRLMMEGEEEEWRRVWERQVVEPSATIVKCFLDDE